MVSLQCWMRISLMWREISVVGIRIWMTSFITIVWHTLNLCSGKAIVFKYLHKSPAEFQKKEDRKDYPI